MAKVETTSKRAEAALWYARQGWRVLPVWPIRDGRCACGDPECEDPGKHPIGSLVPEWKKDATAEVTTVKRWWKAVPDANIATPDWLRLDVDTKDNGLENWRDLCEAHEPLPETPLCLTPSGGRHYYFRPPDGWEHSNRKGTLPPGIDVRGHGTGYTLLSPSNHEQGVYEWELSSRPAEVAVAPLPAWLAEILKSNKAQKTSVVFSENGTDTLELSALNISQIYLDTIRLGHRSGTDRSRIDFAVITALIRDSRTDDEIRAIYQNHPIGTEGKYAERGDKWLAMTIANARDKISGARSDGGDDDEDTARRGTKDALTAEYRAELKRLGYTVKQNAMDDSIWINGELLSDGLRAKIDNQMRDKGFTNSQRIANVYTGWAYESQFHPVRDHLDKLTWDGGDHLAWLMQYMTFGTAYQTDDPKRSWAYWYIKRWMVGAVAKAYEATQNFCLVLDGPQGIGKSYWVRWLCPPDLRDYFSEAHYQAGNKDSRLEQMRNWIWELPELQAVTRKSDREELKHGISRLWIRERPPYGRYPIRKPNLTSFVGTINESGAGFLNDPTGHRRFVVVKLEGIDWDYDDVIDVNQLWAQAVVAYKQGEPWQLTAEEEAKQRLINEGYETSSPLAEMFFTHYRIVDGLDEWMPAMEIIGELEDRGLKGNQWVTLQELAELMAKEGVQKDRPRLEVDGKRKRVTAYKGVIMRPTAARKAQ